MANGDDKSRIPGWLPLLLAVTVPTFGAWVAITKLAENNATQIRELDRRVTIIESNRSEVIPEMYDRLGRIEEQLKLLNQRSQP